ncbi:MAG: hypothetical protein ACOVR6_00475, partial [Fimbriimonas sp.]
LHPQQIPRHPPRLPKSKVGSKKAPKIRFAIQQSPNQSVEPANNDRKATFSCHRHNRTNGG